MSLYYDLGMNYNSLFNNHNVQHYNILDIKILIIKNVSYNVE